MKLFLLVTFIFSSVCFAKAPENAETFNCPGYSVESPLSKPVFLTETKDQLVLGICGKKDDEINNFTKFKVEILSNQKKKKSTVFSDKSDNRKFLVLEKRDGLLLIEKIKVETEYVEMFRHDLVCDKKSCKMKKEICVVFNKVKQKWILDHLKDSKVKSRMKKTGC